MSWTRLSCALSTGSCACVCVSYVCNMVGEISVRNKWIIINLIVIILIIITEIALFQSRITHSVSDYVNVF